MPCTILRAMRLTSFSRWLYPMPVLLGLLVSCGDLQHTDPATGLVQLRLGIASLTALFNAGGETIGLTVGYGRDDASFVPLGTRTVVNADGPQNVQMTVDIASCLNDARRVPAATGCPIVVVVVVQDAAGAMIDSARSAPTSASRGDVITTPISLLRVATVDITLPRPAYALGDTGTATASTRDAANANVTAVVKWRSSNPALLAVDSVTGRFTALGAGPVSLLATSQGKQGQLALNVVSAPPNSRCRGSGHTTIDSAQYRTALSFSATGSPYWMADGGASVLARLDVPPGVTFCTGFLGVSADLGGYVRLVGTAAAPIVFTPLNNLKSILVFALGGTPADSSRFEHVLFDRGGDSTMALINQLGAHPVAIENVRLRQVAVPRAIVATSTTVGVRLTDVVVDTTSTVFAVGDGAPNLEAAVTVNQLSTVNRLTIRRAGRSGFEVLRTSTVPSRLRVTGLVIEDPGINGYVATTSGAEPVVAAGIRVARAGRYPASVTAPHFARAFPTEAAQQLLLGNARDTAIIMSGTVLRDTLRAFEVLPWRVAGSFVLDSGAVLEATAGANIGIAPDVNIFAVNLGRLRIVGSAARPVRIHASSPTALWGLMQLSGGAAWVGSRDSSVIQNAEIEGGGAGTGTTTGMVTAQHRLALNGVRFRATPFLAVYLAATGSRATNINFDSVGGTIGGRNDYALFVGADSVLLRRVTLRSARGYGVGFGSGAVRGIVFDSSTITGSAQAGLVTGVQLSTSGIRLEALNLFGNGAQSLRVDGANQVDARGLWWGSATGPITNQATGNVLTTPWSSSAFVFPAAIRN